MERCYELFTRGYLMGNLQQPMFWAVLRHPAWLYWANVSVLSVLGCPGDPGTSRLAVVGKVPVLGRPRGSRPGTSHLAVLGKGLSPECPGMSQEILGHPAWLYWEKVPVLNVLGCLRRSIPLGCTAHNILDRVLWCPRMSWDILDFKILSFSSGALTFYSAGWRVITIIYYQYQVLTSSNASPVPSFRT
jgi:hypothetical protein